MKLRLCLSGPSGTGKSTLAQHIAKEHNIPFITCSTKPLWEKHNIKSHQDLIGMGTLDPKWGLEFQHEVLKYRIDQLTGKEEFTTDRSPLDNMVYFLLQCAHICTEKEVEDYIKACNESMKLFTGIICLPFTKEIPLENDGMRIANKYYQILVNDTFKTAAGLMIKSLKELKGDTLMMWDWETRVKMVNKLITTIKES